MNPLYRPAHNTLFYNGTCLSPQFPQNREPGERGSLHILHFIAGGFVKLPQLEQYFAMNVRGVVQLVQYFVCSGGFVDEKRFEVLFAGPTPPLAMPEPRDLTSKYPRPIDV